MSIIKLCTYLFETENIRFLARHNWVFFCQFSVRQLETAILDAIQMLIPFQGL
jgi:hypothetical protein